MNAAGLADLDELVLLCRDERSRSYISEAVTCYKAGAFRACIVATWVAVCFDIIGKLADLRLTGNKAAEDILKQIEGARSINDTTAALRLERDLLGHAKDRFEFLSHLEHADLERLRNDRNLCAHPSLISIEQPFTPSAELARVHIRSAVTSLLQHPPVQGQHALERLKGDVTSEYFPTKKKDALSYLLSGPLRRPRDTLVRSFVVWLLQIILSEQTNHRLRSRAYAALVAARGMHLQVVNTLLSDKLSSILEHVRDNDVHLMIDVIDTVGDCWQYLKEDVRLRIASYVESLPAEHLHQLEFLLSFEPLCDKAQDRLNACSKKELGEALWFGLPPLVAEKYVDIYINSKNFAEANDWAIEVIVHADDFSAAQQERILRGVSENREVGGSFGARKVVAALQQSKKLKPAVFLTLLDELDLASLAPEQDGESQEL